MSVDGVSDYLIVEHTEALALGKDGADYTISFALIQTASDPNNPCFSCDKVFLMKGGQEWEATLSNLSLYLI
jgi:hypothetical protein